MDLSLEVEIREKISESISGAPMWISYAERPLKLDELCHGLNIRITQKLFRPEAIFTFPA